jgi:hypothetical protein
MDLENQIRKALWEYASSRVSLDEFRSRFVPISWDIEKSQDPAAIKLAHHIDGILAEASTAGWTEEQLHEELRGSVAAMPFAIQALFPFHNVPRNSPLIVPLQRERSLFYDLSID